MTTHETEIESGWSFIDSAGSARPIENVDLHTLARIGLRGLHVEAQIMAAAGLPIDPPRVTISEGVIREPEGAPQ